MEYIDSKGATRIADEFAGNEVNEYRKSTTERDLGNIAPEAKEAFNRKPYGSYSVIGLKKRPIVRVQIHAPA
jgi:hypothetical protein